MQFFQKLALIPSLHLKPRAGFHFVQPARKHSPRPTADKSQQTCQEPPFHCSLRGKTRGKLKTAQDCLKMTGKNHTRT